MNTSVHEWSQRAVRVAMPVVLAMAALTMGGAARAVVPDHCVSVDVPAPMTLPDGSVHSPGELRLCLSGNYNPVTGLHRVYLDRMPLTMLLSRASNAEVPKDSQPTVLFYGSLDTGLRLVGYTVSANGKVFSYLLWNARADQGVDVAAGSSGMDGAPAMSDSESVLLAARLE